jgi:chorismate mutase
MKIHSLLLASLIISASVFSKGHAQTNSKENATSIMEIQRRKIDSLDKKLMEILGARQRAVKEIGIYKAKNNIPSLQAGRFQEVERKSIEAGQKEGLSAEFITKILTAIHEESLRVEENLKRIPAASNRSGNYILIDRFCYYLGQGGSMRFFINILHVAVNGLGDRVCRAVWGGGVEWDCADRGVYYPVFVVFLSLNGLFISLYQ